MVESKWILTLKSGFAPSTHFASTLDCCEQTTLMRLASDCGCVWADKRSEGKFVVEQWGPPVTRLSHGQSWPHENTLTKHSPAVHHVQQPSPTYHKLHQFGGLHCCDDLSSHAQAETQNLRGQQKLSFPFPFMFKPIYNVFPTLRDSVSPRPR